MATNYLIRKCPYCKKIFHARCASQFYCSIICSFWDKIQIKSPNKCWNWIAGKDTDGYGVFAIKRKQIKAHRYMWEITHGMILFHYHVLHKCDNPSCVNPNHLWLGTNYENIIDCINKDRHTRGERNSRAKLTDKKVFEIRKAFTEGKGNVEIAKKHRVHRATIWGIRCNGKWSHV